MKTIKGTVLILAFVIASATQSLAVVDQAIAVQGTNLVLSWPSQGYEYYMIQYWPDLSMPSIQLTNCVPANSTNRTTFIIPCCTMAGLGGGSGTNSGGGSIEPPGASMSMSGASASDESDWGSDLWVVQSDGSELPLKMYPPGIDTNGMVLTDTPPADTENEFTPSFGANAFGGAAETPAGITNGGCDCPSYGFFRVWHIPNWLASFTNYTFDGPTFVPIDFKDYRDRVDNTTVLVNGQPTPYAQVIQLEISGQMYWGAGIDFERLANGTNTIQLISTLRTSDSLDDNTGYQVLSNLTQNITIGNLVLFTNWDNTIWNNTNYTFQAQCSVTDVDWEIDIYDVYGDFVNSQTGHSDDGSISWQWDLYDYLGNPRTDSDSDPVFYPYVTITTTNGGFQPNASQTRPAPPVAASFPSVGNWLFAYMDGFYSDAGSNYVSWDSYYKGIMSNLILGGPDQWDIPAASFAIKFGTNYSQGDRDGSWSNLVNALSNPQYRNFYYYGHGSAHSVGGDSTTFDTSGFPTGAQENLNSQAHMTSQDVRDKITVNNPLGACYYRFVFLDGCHTADGDLPDAWGIAKTTNDISFYSSAANTSHLRPSVFVGWNTTPGGTNWGTVPASLGFRSAWMANWSVNNGNDQDNLSAVFDFSAQNAPEPWPPGGVNQLHSALMIYGYRDLKFNDYNHQGNWPPP